MKKLRKMFAAVLAVAMVCCFSVWLAACGNASVEGTWYFDSMKMNVGGIETSYEVGKEMQGITITKEFMKMEFKSDGSLEMINSMMPSGSVSGTWTQDGNTVSITFNGETQEGTISGNKLTLSETGGGTSQTVVLKKG